MTEETHKRERRTKKDSGEQAVDNLFKHLFPKASSSQIKEFKTELSQVDPDAVIGEMTKEFEKSMRKGRETRKKSPSQKEVFKITYSLDGNHFSEFTTTPITRLQELKRQFPRVKFTTTLAEEFKD